MKFHNEDIEKTKIVCECSITICNYENNTVKMFPTSLVQFWKDQLTISRANGLRGKNRTSKMIRLDMLKSFF